MNHMILSNGDYAIGKYVPTDAVLVPPKPNGPYSWNGTQWVFNGYTAVDALNRLRFERNQLLQQTDWWVLPDRTATQAQLDYRQALRDLPQNSSPELGENGQLINVQWPEKPE